MTKTYKIDFKNQLRCLQFAMITTALIFIGTYILLPQDSLLIISLVASALNAPVIFLHTSYYFKNRRQSFSVNQTKQLISITSNKIVREYPFSKIAYIEKHLGIYFRNRIDKMGRREAPWSNYGYIKIKIDDGSIFYLTSLMLNPVTFDIGIPYKVKFNTLPYLGNNELRFEQERKIIEKLQREKIDEYKKPFIKLSSEELQKKIETKEKFAKEAITAAQEILTERDAELQ